MHQNQDAAAQAAGPIGPPPQFDSSALAADAHEPAVSPDGSVAPAPLTPAEMDLRGLPFMPLDVNRLRDSGLALEASAEEFRAAILLWCACWNQIPAASLPNSDVSLAAYAGLGRDLKAWKRVKRGAMRGFVLCSDGLYYHPVVAEKAADAWAERLEYREVKENDRLRKAQEREDRKDLFAKLRSVGVVMPGTTQTAKLREHWASLSGGVDTSHGHNGSGHAEVTPTRHAPVTAKKGQGQGERRDRDRDSLKPSSSKSTSADIYQTVAATMARTLRNMGWAECADGHPELIEAAKAGITEQAIQQAAVGKTGKPISYLVKRARGMHADAVANNSGASTPIVDLAAVAAAAELAQLRRGLEDKISQAHNDFKLELIDVATRNERIANYQQALGELGDVVEGGLS